MLQEKFTILISTHNRVADLDITIRSMKAYGISGMPFIIVDDGSKDGTYEFLQKDHPDVQVYRHEKAMGYLYSRNFLMSLATTPYVLMLDDDANFISVSPFEKIEAAFQSDENIALVAPSIFWGKSLPENAVPYEMPQQVKSFVGCGHIWRMSAWHKIPDYPVEFQFYGEEDYSSMHLFKQGMKVQYVPEVLVHHRVDLQQRKSNSDHEIRLKRSLRAGWLIILALYPKKIIPRRLSYSLWIQLKNKVFKGDMKSFKAISTAIWSVLGAHKTIKKLRDPLPINAFQAYEKLPDSRIYWKPK